MNLFEMKRAIKPGRVTRSQKRTAARAKTEVSSTKQWPRLTIPIGAEEDQALVVADSLDERERRG